MTRQWTIDHTRLIAERVFEWQVTEINGKLFLVDSEQRPAWMPTCEVPDWPNSLGAAAAVLSQLVKRSAITVEQAYDCELAVMRITLRHPHDSRFPIMREHRNWPVAVMWAIWAGVL